MQMYPKLATAVAISMLVSTAALAQTQTASDKGQWQASKLIHMNVYNAQNEKIGDIKELMLDKNGKVNTVAIGVGGFLGMGERDVAVKFDQLKWSNDPPKSASWRQAPRRGRRNRRRIATATIRIMPCWMRRKIS